MAELNRCSLLCIDGYIVVIGESALLRKNTKVLNVDEALWLMNNEANMVKSWIIWMMENYKYGVSFYYPVNKCFDEAEVILKHHPPKNTQITSR